MPLAFPAYASSKPGPTPAKIRESLKPVRDFGQEEPVNFSNSF